MINNKLKEGKMEARSNQQRESRRWGTVYESIGIRYQVTHERFIVPWQMDHSKAKEIPVD